MIFRFAILSLIFAISLTACGGLTERADDAAPLPDNVSSESAGESNAQPVSGEQAQTPAQAQTGPVLSFNIEGGIVGFCDELLLNANGDYALNNCAAGQNSGTLNQTDRVSLKTWSKDLAGFQIHAEDNAAGADNLIADLTFFGTGQTEADDVQKQMMYDWVNGLLVQLRPKPKLEPMPTPVPVAVGANGICPDVNRPAVMLLNFENPGNISLMDVDSQTTCEVALHHPPFGRVATAAGNIFYPVADSEAKTVTVWQLGPDGRQKPLEFTRVAMEEPRPYGVAVSDDGSKIGWSYTAINLETEPPTYQNYLWVANVDGSEQVTVLAGVENDDLRFVSPIQFSSADNSTLFYTLQPDIGGPTFSGRLDTLYSAPAGRAGSELVYACDTEENPVCITGLAPDGSVYTVVNPASGTIQVINRAGEIVNLVDIPGTDYVEKTLFGPNGDLAFVSATLARPAGEEDTPLPNPGYITVMSPPFLEDARTLFSDASVGTLRGWVDEGRLIFGSIDSEGNTGTAVISLEGQVSDVSPRFAVGVFR